MKFDWRSNRDFFAGLTYILTGAIGVWIARDYPFGSALRMGPGYFPTVLESAAARAQALKKIRGSGQVEVAGADHFFTGREAELVARVAQFLDARLRP